MGWESYRDRRFLEIAENIVDSSVDAVARDMWFRNGYKADLVVYRSEKDRFEVTDFYTPESSSEEFVTELVKSIRAIDTLLLEEGRDYRSTLSRTDNQSSGDFEDFEGNLALDYTLEEFLSDFEEVMSPGFEPRPLDRKQ